MPALRSVVLRLETLVITEHTHSEHNDWQEPGGEQLSVSETPTPQPAMDAPVQDEGQKNTEEARAEEKQAEGGKDEAEHASDQEQPVQPEASETSTLAAEQETQEESPTVVSFEETNVMIEETVTTSVESLPSHLLESGETLFPLSVETPLPIEEIVRPFTDFIEEFRQTEGHFSSLLTEPDTSFSAFVAGSESLHEPVTFLEETAPEDLAQVVDLPPFQGGEGEQVGLPASNETSTAPVAQPEETAPALTQPRLSPERPVSPLLRPATRPRLPRHGRHRIDELIHPAELHGDVKAGTPTPAATPASASVEEPVSAVETPVVAEPRPEVPPVKPARRYRFDRPAASAASTASTPAKTTTRAAESKEKRNPAAQAESVASAEPTPPRATAVPSVPVEVPAAKPSSVEETAPASIETPAPVAPTPTERRRRGSHERTREKEQPVTAPAVVPEPVAPVVEPAPAIAEEIALEDLPPLEYSELQAANSRRRRRRRAGAASTAAAAPGVNGSSPSKAVLPEIVAPPTPPAPPAPPAPVAPRSVPTVPPSYNIVSGYTVNQMNQGNDLSGPFMGPEPSPARGSTFTSSSVRPVRNDALRSTSAHAAKHSEGPTLSAASINHMANVVAQAMQTQTDRMVAELRRANQVPTNVSVSLPPFPSTERVGVFVDVANLLYSARTLRITVDFGKLLDFLRGNRRLVRAQAYCPTSPQPGDDQMFLQAVKGLGYRITTKNYKTFSSGAKKADLDLDLCMDVVRLVDGKAVDCIVLVSGDSDFMPMLDYCSDHGVRVEVAAFDESMSATLRQSCDLFVNLSMLEEIRL